MTGGKVSRWLYAIGFGVMLAWLPIAAPPAHAFVTVGVGFGPGFHQPFYHPFWHRPFFHPGFYGRPFHRSWWGYRGAFYPRPFYRPLLPAVAVAAPLPPPPPQPQPVPAPAPVYHPPTVYKHKAAVVHHYVHKLCHCCCCRC